VKLIVTSMVLIVVFVALGLWLWTPDRDRATLEAKYAHGPADFLEVAGIRLHVRDTGPKAAPAVILVHGFGSSLHTWEAWAQTLAGDYRVIRFDLPGAGLTGPDPTGDYTDARSLPILAGLMDRLGLARASLIGNSIGGRIAWKFAAEYPARVDKLVLVSPDGFESPGFEYGRKPDVPSFVRLMRLALPASVLRMNLAPAFGDPAALTDDLVTRYHDLMLAPGVRDAMIARMEQAVLQDPVPLLRRIQAPTLLLWGERDAMIPFANARDYVGALAHATLVPLAGLGHVPQEEAPARSLQPVIAFLKR
jgi:pimeloyl-ACP methyl ester carboxylesterase